MQAIQEPTALSIRNILLATDFSPASARAADYARALTSRFASTVQIAHVFAPLAILVPGELGVTLPVEDASKRSSENLDRWHADFLRAGVDVRTLSLESRKPAQAILQAASEQDVDLIVTGTTSKVGFERVILGSTAEEIIRSAECPVLTVGPKAKPPADGPLAFSSIVYATDFSPEAIKAAVFALSFAEDSGARLFCCYVSSAEGTNADERDYLDLQFKEALERMIPESSYDWCNPECVVAHGDASQAILDLARRVGADLIVLGARKSSYWLTHIERGMTPHLLAEATCPVLTVS